MNLGIGVLLITLMSFLLTWFMFGGTDTSRRNRFIYWLKSTVFLWVALVIWVSYKEPDINILIIGGVSLVFSTLVNALRSQWVFMLP